MTPSAMKRLRMGLLLGSVALVAVVLWLSTGYGLGHDSYAAPDGSFHFEYPANYTAAFAEFSDGGTQTQSVTAQGSAAIRVFTVVRKIAWAKTMTAEQRLPATQAFLDRFLVDYNPQVKTRRNQPRPIGVVHRLEAGATMDGRAVSVALECLAHGDDLYLFSIEGESDAIVADPEGERFFNSIRFE